MLVIHDEVCPFTIIMLSQRDLGYNYNYITPLAIICVISDLTYVINADAALWTLNDCMRYSASRVVVRLISIICD